jgi:hypothetical protein
MKETLRFLYLIALAFTGCMCIIMAITENNVDFSILGFVILFYLEFKDEQFERKNKNKGYE